MELDDDCTASILESLHQRVAKLEDVWKVQYEIADAKQPLEMLLTETKYNHKNTLFPAIKSMGGKVYGEIWTNPLSNFKKVGKGYRVEIGEEIKVRDTSNGADCLLVVTRGKINNTDVVLKFRLVDYKSEKMTEVEAKHALSTSLNKDMHGLFPELFAVMKIVTGVGAPTALTLAPGVVRPYPVLAKRQMTWECIATEPLEELDLDDKKSVNIQLECCRLLKNLHSNGYIHGDPHMGNFMKKKVSDGKYVVYMIDQDEIRKLPANDKAISNLLQILDYQALAMWNNPRFTALVDIEKEGGRDMDISNAVNMACKFFRYHTYMFSPEPFWFYKGQDVRAIRARLPAEYIRFLSLDDMDTLDIYNSFANIVKKDGVMKGANDLLMEAWHKKRLGYYVPRKIKLPTPS